MLESVAPCVFVARRQARLRLLLDTSHTSPTLPLTLFPHLQGDRPGCAVAVHADRTAAPVAQGESVAVWGS